MYTVHLFKSFTRMELGQWARQIFLAVEESKALTCPLLYIAGKPRAPLVFGSLLCPPFKRLFSLERSYAFCTVEISLAHFIPLSPAQVYSVDTSRILSSIMDS